MLDKKIKDTGVLMPTTPLIIDTVLSEMEKMKIFVHEEFTMISKF